MERLRIEQENKRKEEQLKAEEEQKKRIEQKKIARTSTTKTQSRGRKKKN